MTWARGNGTGLEGIRKKSAIWVIRAQVAQGQGELGDAVADLLLGYAGVAEEEAGRTGRADIEGGKGGGEDAASHCLGRGGLVVGAGREPTDQVHTGVGGLYV